MRELFYANAATVCQVASTSALRITVSKPDYRVIFDHYNPTKNCLLRAYRVYNSDIRIPSSVAVTRRMFELLQRYRSWIEIQYRSIEGTRQTRDQLSRKQYSASTNSTYCAVMPSRRELEDAYVMLMLSWDVLQEGTKYVTLTEPIQLELL